jgi:glucose-6-phosphate isomerase
MEIFEYFELNLRHFGEWLKQLFGESEGKDGKGAYPASLGFATDLHSIGQFLQQGNQMFYETLICIEKSNYDFVIPESAGHPYAGKTLEAINGCSEQGVITAHKKGGVPVISITIPALNEEYLGQLIYFFEMSCAISAYNLGVNPFDQPGVEAYKKEMRKARRDMTEILQH